MVFPWLFHGFPMVFPQFPWSFSHPTTPSVQVLHLHRGAEAQCGQVLLGRHRRGVAENWDPWGSGGFHSQGYPKEWWVFHGKSENPNLKWMRTGGSPMTSRKPPRLFKRDGKIRELDRETGNWLVVWNMFYVSIHLGIESSQLIFIFFRGEPPTR